MGSEFMQPIAAFFLVILPCLNPFAGGPSSGMVSQLFSWACAGALLLVFIARSKRASGPQLLRATAAAWLGAALLSAALGLLQYLGATNGIGPWVNHTAVGEAFANLRQRNQFATLTNIGLAALLWWVAQGGTARLLLPRWRTSVGHAAPSACAPSGCAGVWMPLTAALLLGIGNAASSSRTGLLQLLVLIGMAWGWSWCGSADAGHGKDGGGLYCWWRRWLMVLRPWPCRVWQG